MSFVEDFIETIPESNNVRCSNCGRTGTIYMRSVTWGSDLDYSPYYITTLRCSNCGREGSSCLDQEAQQYLKSCIELRAKRLVNED